MAKKKKIEPELNSAEAGNRTMVVSLFIILLAFFIVLNSIAVVDEQRKLEAIGSLIGSFGILPGGLSPFSDETSGRSIKPPVNPMVEAKKETLPDFVGLSSESSQMVDIRPTPQGSLISIRDKVLFEDNSYRIRPSARQFLVRLAQIVNSDRFPVKITGHTDDRPALEKNVSSNWELSAKRAMAIYRFFFEEYKKQLKEKQITGSAQEQYLYPKRIDAYGCGPYQPLASNDTPQTRALNNRVEILVDKRAAYRLRRIYKKEPAGLFVFRKFVFSVLE